MRPMRPLADSLARLAWAAHYEGWSLTLLRPAVNAGKLVGTRGTSARWFQRLKEQRFDARFNVQTQGFIESEKLALPRERKTHAASYAPTASARFGWLLSQLPVDLSEFAFVDFGCGKGRALLMAAEFPFQRVLGVELAPELCAAAARNILRFRSHRCRCAEIQALHLDATEFSFPDDPLILFFFNPFSSQILQRVVENLQLSLKAKPRPAIVIYHNPLHAEVFEATPELIAADFAVQPGRDWKLYSSRLPAAATVAAIRPQIAAGR